MGRSEDKPRWISMVTLRAGLALAHMNQKDLSFLYRVAARPDLAELLLDEEPMQLFLDACLYE